MSLLSHDDLLLLALNNVITEVTPGMINSASIDITIGKNVLVERDHGRRPENRIISLKSRTPLDMDEHDLLVDGPIVLAPGEFVLAQSAQVFNLPNDISAEYKLKSSMARIGLEHLNAGWCDAGWNGSVLTLELKNMTRYHSIEIDAGVGIGQMVFFNHPPVSEGDSYAARRRYNGDTMVSGIKE